MKPTKVLYAVRLPTYIVNWLRDGARDIPGASLITMALKAHYKIPTPEELATKAAGADKKRKPVGRPGNVKAVITHDQFGALLPPLLDPQFVAWYSKNYPDQGDGGYDDAQEWLETLLPLDPRYVMFKLGDIKLATALLDAYPENRING